MAKKIVAIITGDIISSQSKPTGTWLRKLKSVLKTIGDTPKHWEIYRGDSFQLEISKEDAITKALIIKSELKKVKDIDVRMAIGIGSQDYKAQKITESNGEAFVRSGKCFNELKKTTLAISTGNTDFDEKINLMLSLAMLTADNWKPVTSSLISIAMQNEEISQENLAKKLKKAQSTISAGLKRGGYDEMQMLIAYYKKEITKL